MVRTFFSSSSSACKVFSERRKTGEPLVEAVQRQVDLLLQNPYLELQVSMTIKTTDNLGLSEVRKQNCKEEDVKLHHLEQKTLSENL